MRAAGAACSRVPAALARRRRRPAVARSEAAERRRPRAGRCEHRDAGRSFIAGEACRARIRGEAPRSRSCRDESRRGARDPGPGGRAGVAQNGADDDHETGLRCHGEIIARDDRLVERQRRARRRESVAHDEADSPGRRGAGGPRAPDYSYGRHWNKDNDEHVRVKPETKAMRPRPPHQNQNGPADATPRGRRGRQAEAEALTGPRAHQAAFQAVTPPAAPGGRHGRHCREREGAGGVQSPERAERRAEPPGRGDVVALARALRAWLLSTSGDLRERLVGLHRPAPKSEQLAGARGAGPPKALNSAAGGRRRGGHPAAGAMAKSVPAEYRCLTWKSPPAPNTASSLAVPAGKPVAPAPAGAPNKGRRSHGDRTHPGAARRFGPGRGRAGDRPRARERAARGDSSCFVRAAESADTAGSRSDGGASPAHPRGRDLPARRRGRASRRPGSAA